MVVYAARFYCLRPVGVCAAQRWFIHFVAGRHAATSQAGGSCAAQSASERRCIMAKGGVRSLFVVVEGCGARKS
jgi:hypothetical protein